MKTSRKTDYAIHSLMILARQNNDEVSVKRLAEKQNISATYLAKVMQKLASAGIVNFSEGKSGGYKMLKSAGDIKVAVHFNLQLIKSKKWPINLDKTHCI